MYKSLSLTGSLYNYEQISLSQEAPYQYVQISLSQEAGTNIYKYLSQKGAGTNMYKSLSYKEPVQICTYSTNLSLTGSWFKYVQISFSQEPVHLCTNLSLLGRLYKFVQISLSQDPVPLCTNLKFFNIFVAKGFTLLSYVMYTVPFSNICETF